MHYGLQKALNTGKTYRKRVIKKHTRKIGGK